MPNDEYYRVTVTTVLPVTKEYLVPKSKAESPRAAEQYAQHAAVSEGGTWFQDGAPRSEVIATCDEVTH